MNKKISTLFLCFILGNIGLRSQNLQPLPSPINLALNTEKAPSLSATGRILVYENTIGLDDQSVVAISYQRNGSWTRPEQIPGISSTATRVFNGAHFLTYDGNSIFFSSNRYGGIGGNDIWYIEKVGNSWSAPKNLGKPVNSTGLETDPSLSPDGKTLYFVRMTAKKGPKGEDCGKIFYSERKGKDTWTEPKELPSQINAGCECNPRILSDNISLTFASVRPNGKGNYDQFKTEMNPNGQWAAPLAMDFINTSEDDRYISIPANGEFVYLTSKAKMGTDIFRARIPENLKPQKILILSGNIIDEKSGQPIPASVSVNSQPTSKFNIQKADDGNYFLLLKEKEMYSITIIPEKKGYPISSFNLDLDTLKKYKELRFDIKTKPLAVNSAFSLNIDFEETSNNFTTNSILELNRFQKLLQENPTLKVELSVFSENLLNNSEQRDSVATMADSTADSTAISATNYINERTQLQAEKIVNYLESKGISKDKVLINNFIDRSAYEDLQGPEMIKSGKIFIKIIQK